MNPAIAVRGETPFPEAGEGVVLRFTNADLKLLQQKFGPEFISDAHGRFDAWDMDFADDILALGAKKDGQPAGVTMTGKLDDVPLAETFEKLLDAIYVSYHGKTFRQHVEEVSEAIAEMQRNGEVPSPLSPDTTLSTSSGSGLSDTASDPKSSGGSRRLRSGSGRAKAQKAP